MDKNCGVFIKLLSANGKLLSYNKKEIIQDTEDQHSFFLVKSGFVKRYIIHNDGSIGVDVLYGPGDVFSLTLLFKILFDDEILESSENHFYEALTSNTQLYRVESSKLKDLINDDPLIYKAILQETGKRLTYITHGLENEAMKVARKRLAHLLVYDARHFGAKTIEDNEITLIPTFTHQDLADFLSTTRETVSVSMAALRRSGLIEVKKGNILVKDLDKLTIEAYS